MRSVRRRVCCALTVSAALASGPAAAEGPAIRPPLRSVMQGPAVSGPTRFAVGLGFIVSEPKEAFDENVGVGFGVGGAFQYHVDRPGWFAVRFDAAWLRYGHETKRVPFSQTVGGRILVDVSTSNSIIGLGVGPEVALPYGPVRPYLNAGFSGLLFRTASSVSGIRSSDEPIAATTNLSDWTGAWVLGAGLRFPLGGRESPVDLDLGVRYHRGGEALYLREGSIIDNPDGSITIHPLNSRTPFMVYGVGVRFRIPWSSTDPCPRWLC